MENRELKFRVWRYCDGEKSNKMYYTDRAKLMEFDSADIIFRTNSEHDWVDGSAFYPDKSVIMQYTGLKDKNGKEIFEGDILKVNPNEEPFDKDTYWQQYKVEIPAIFYTLEHFATNGIKEDFEIIGNIYQNPDLKLSPRNNRYKMEKAIKFIDMNSVKSTDVLEIYGDKRKLIPSDIAKQAVKMAQSNCECSPEETTGNILEPVCNICGRVQKENTDTMKCVECKKEMDDMEHNYGTPDLPCCIHCFAEADENIK